MIVTGAAPPRNPRSGSLALVARVPFYRGATLALFLSGVGFSAAAPQIATFLVRELDASRTTVGLYYLTNLTAPIAGYLIGARSDRTGRRLGLFRVCALVGALGWAGIALFTQLWMPFALSALALAVAGAATSSCPACSGWWRWSGCWCWIVGWGIVSERRRGRPDRRPSPVGRPVGLTSWTPFRPRRDAPHVPGRAPWSAVSGQA